MRSPMARNSGFLFVLISVVVAICEATSFQPVSENHRSAALELFSPVDGSFTSLEEAYEAVRTFQILGGEKSTVSSSSTCPLVVKNLQSSSSPKDLFYALKVNSFLNCKVEANIFAGISSKLQAAVKVASSVLDYYYSVGSLVLIKDKGAAGNALLADGDGTFHSIKALSHSDGRWRLNSKSAESSIYAAGLALEALAGVVSLSSTKIDQSLIGTVKNDVVKLFDSLEKYDDGASYFNEKLTDTREDQGPITTSASVVRGLASFAAVIDGKINLPGDKFLGLAKFFLGVGVPGSAKDFFNQIDSLYNLENKRVSVPLILSLPATVVPLTDKKQLKVKVTTVLGSSAPPLTVKLVQAFQPSSKDTPLIENQELKFDPESNAHSLDVLPLGFDIGKYIFVFRVLLHDSEHKKIYATGDQTQVSIFFTGSIKVDNAEIAVLDSDLQSTGNKKKLDLSGDTSLSLSADHLQKLQLAFQLTTTLGNSFKPEQVFLKLTHETKVEHIFVVGSSGSQFEIVLDFLRLLKKFYYLSGRYSIQLTVGDAAVENSFHRDLGYVELDLPKAPEKATHAPLQPADPYSRYVPKPEITHIFRLPEKRPRQELSLAFLVLTFVPLFGFILGLLRLGVNLKKFPTSESSPLVHAVLFHIFLAAILGWYLLFWLKMDLFTTLKQLGILGAMLLYFGHRTLSYLASGSSKQKSA